MHVCMLIYLYTCVWVCTCERLFFILLYFPQPCFYTFATRILFSKEPSKQAYVSSLFLLNPWLATGLGQHIADERGEDGRWEGCGQRMSLFSSRGSSSRGSTAGGDAGGGRLGVEGNSILHAPNLPPMLHPDTLKPVVLYRDSDDANKTLSEWSAPSESTTTSPPVPMSGFEQLLIDQSAAAQLHSEHMHARVLEVEQVWLQYLFLHLCPSLCLRN